MPRRRPEYHHAGQESSEGGVRTACRMPLHFALGKHCDWRFVIVSQMSSMSFEPSIFLNTFVHCVRWEDGVSLLLLLDTRVEATLLWQSRAQTCIGTECAIC